MATFIQNRYTTTHKVYKRIQELLPKQIEFNTWYAKDLRTYIYFNNRGYYHMVMLKKYDSNYYVFEDYILSKDMEFRYNKQIATFKTLVEVKEYILEKIKGIKINV